jgi:hypothetical protein
MESFLLPLSPACTAGLGWTPLCCDTGAELPRKYRGVHWVDMALKKVKSRAVYGMVARLAPVALQPWKPPGVYQRSTAAVFPPPAAAGTFTIGTLQIFLSPRISPFFYRNLF